MPKKSINPKDKPKTKKKIESQAAKRDAKVEAILGLSRDAMARTDGLLPKPKASAQRPAKPLSKQGASSNSGVAPTPPTAAEFLTLLTYGLFTPAELLHLLRAPAGYELIARKVLADWKEIEADFKVPGLSTAALEDALDTRDIVAPLEVKIVPFFQRATENRRVADSIAMSMLLKFARAVKNSGDPDLIQRFQPLLDWVKSTHAPKKSSKKKSAAKRAAATTANAK